MTDFDDLLLRSEEPFAFGASRYWDAHPEVGESQPRVYVRFRPQGVDPSRSFLALLDTGAHYCILNSALVELIRDQLTESMGTIKLRTAHGPVQGKLYRYQITLVAETGSSPSAQSLLLWSVGIIAAQPFGAARSNGRLRDVDELAGLTLVDDHAKMCITLMHIVMHRRSTTMNAITLRNIPTEIQEAIRQRAEADSQSFNKAVLRMLEEHIGLRRRPGPMHHHDLDHLAGTWSEEEAEAFDAALAEQRRIDPELWK